jgi:ABC-type Fe3+-hydroxamate transport system substrate-binding protein
MAGARVYDDRKRLLDFRVPPKRVVSLVPSDTWNVAALGCDDALVGRTDWCELPAEVVAKLPSVGGTKNPRVDAILDLAPDLVLANQEENTRGDLEALVGRGVRVYVAFPKRVADGLGHLAKLARIFGVEHDRSVAELFRCGYDRLRATEESVRRAPAIRTFCPIWMEPLMTVNGDTFISDMLEVCGAENVFAGRQRRYPLAADLGKAVPFPPEKVGDRDVRYPRVTLDEVVSRAPELVILPDEPHPFTEEDADVFRALDIPAVRPGGVVRTDGKDLCWYGARSVDGILRVRNLVRMLERSERADE